MVERFTNKFLSGERLLQVQKVVPESERREAEVCEPGICNDGRISSVALRHGPSSFDADRGCSDYSDCGRGTALPTDSYGRQMKKTSADEADRAVAAAVARKRTQQRNCHYCPNCFKYCFRSRGNIYEISGTHFLHFFTCHKSTFLPIRVINRNNDNKLHNRNNIMEAFFIFHGCYCRRKSLSELEP